MCNALRLFYLKNIHKILKEGNIEHTFDEDKCSILDRNNKDISDSLICVYKSGLDKLTNSIQEFQEGAKAMHKFYEKEKVKNFIIITMLAFGLFTVLFFHGF